MKNSTTLPAKIATLILLFLSSNLFAQTNNFPSSGNVCIGTYPTPAVSKLQVDGAEINSTGATLAPDAFRKIGFGTNQDPAGVVANYGLTYSKTFLSGSATGYPGVTLSGFYGLAFYTNAQEKMRIDDGGQVGIGKIPTSKLDVNGDIMAIAIKGPSDIRFKKNIKPLENALDKVLALNGYTYEWRNEEFPDRNFKKGKDVGLIAQEVEKIIPEVVYTDANDMKSKSIDYTKLVPVLVESIKEMQKEIEALKKALNEKK